MNNVMCVLTIKITKASNSIFIFIAYIYSIYIVRTYQKRIHALKTTSKFCVVCVIVHMLYIIIIAKNTSKVPPPILWNISLRARDICFAVDTVCEVNVVFVSLTVLFGIGNISL